MLTLKERFLQIFAAFSGNLNFMFMICLMLENFQLPARSHGLQGYRNRYDIIDHGHEKTTFMYILHRSILGMARGIPRPLFLEVLDLFSLLDSPRNRFYHSSDPRGPRQNFSWTSKDKRMKIY